MRVSLKDGLTILDLRPDNRVTVANLRQIIKHNGFVSKEVQIVATGTPRTIDGRPGLEVSGTGEVVRAGAAPQKNGDLWRVTVLSDSK